MKAVLFSFFAFISLNLSVYGEILNVPGAYSSIQEAINAAKTGDTVLVAEGTYYENINFTGKNIIVASHFILEKNPDYIHSTIIDGSRSADTTRASCVLFISGEDTSAILEGFTLTGGKGIAWQDEHGARNIFTEGGGIFITLSSPTIRNNIIINNEAIKVDRGMQSAGGGGIRCGDSKARILNNVIADNKGLYGAGIVLNYCAGMIIANNIFYNNQVYQAVAGTPTFGGGAIWIYNVLPGDNTPNQVVNNTVVSNSSSGSGGSMAGRGGGLLLVSCNAKITNNVFWHNTQTSGGQIHNAASQQITYNLIEGGMTGEGNFNADPCFSDGSYQLMSNSPCIDKGNPSTQYNDPEDANNPGYAIFPSFGTIINDMGAFGGPGSLPYLDLITEVKTNSEVPYKFCLEQNYPNPFNPTTRILFNLPEFSQVSIKIFNILGAEIGIPVNSEFPAGRHEIVFDASNLPSGVYIYKVTAGKFSDSKKMILLR